MAKGNKSENSDAQDLSERLAGISGSPSRAAGGSRMVRYAGFGLLAAILGAGGYYAAQLSGGSNSDLSLPTSVAQEFPEDQTSFADLERPSNPVIVREVENTQTGAEIDALRAQLKAMQDQISDNNRLSDAEREKQLRELREDMDRHINALKTAADEAQKKAADREDELLKEIGEMGRQNKRDQAAKDAEIQRLRAQLAGANVAADSGVDPLADAEADAAAKYALRVQSEMGVSLQGTGGVEGGEADPRERSDREAFVRREIETVKVSKAERIARPDATVIQGTIIRAALETAVDSSLPGTIRAVVSEDVHSLDGTNIVIPRGSKLYGEYDSDLAIADRRILVAWTRIVLPDGKVASIASFGADRLGRSGSTGRVKTHFMQRFGGAALISIISSIPDIAAASVEDDTTSDTLQNVGQDLSNATDDVISEYLKIAPTIFIHQGAEVTVILDQDVEIL